MNSAAVRLLLLAAAVSLLGAILPHRDFERLMTLSRSDQTNVVWYTALPVFAGVLTWGLLFAIRASERGVLIVAIAAQGLTYFGKAKASSFLALLGAQSLGSVAAVLGLVATSVLAAGLLPRRWILLLPLIWLVAQRLSPWLGPDALSTAASAAIWPYLGALLYAGLAAAAFFALPPPENLRENLPENLPGAEPLPYLEGFAVARAYVLVAFASIGSVATLVFLQEGERLNGRGWPFPSPPTIFPYAGTVVPFVVVLALLFASGRGRGLGFAIRVAGALGVLLMMLPWAAPLLQSTLMTLLPWQPVFILNLVILWLALGSAPKVRLANPFGAWLIATLASLSVLPFVVPPTPGIALGTMVIAGIGTAVLLILPTGSVLRTDEAKA